MHRRRVPTTSFVRGIAALTLADRALSVLLHAAEGSTFAGLRKRAVRILADERFHQRFADGRVRELADSPALQRDLAALLPETLCWFGPEGELGLDLLVDTEILTRRNEELRQEFLGSLGALVDKTGVELPIAGRAGDWTYPELPWSEWSSLERRLPTSPAPATS